MGSPEDTRIERELSDGALRVAVRAYERELAWAPPYVAKDAAGTSRAAEDARTEAALLEAQGQAEEAAAAHDRAELLGAQAAQLQEASDIRAQWFLRNLETKHHAERAREELDHRGVDLNTVEDKVTATEWLAAHRTELAVEEPHRAITDVDIAHDTDNMPERFRDIAHDPVLACAESAQAIGMVAEMPLPDIRERVEVEEPIKANEDDWSRIPDADTARASVDAAARALDEMTQRQSWEDQREAEDQAWLATNWDASQALDSTDDRVDVAE